MPDGSDNGTKIAENETVKILIVLHQLKFNFLLTKSSHVFKLWQEEINEMNRQV